MKSLQKLEIPAWPHFRLGWRSSVFQHYLTNIHVTCRVQCKTNYADGWKLLAFQRLAWDFWKVGQLNRTNSVQPLFRSFLWMRCALKLCNRFICIMYHHIISLNMSSPEVKQKSYYRIVDLWYPQVFSLWSIWWCSYCPILHDIFSLTVFCRYRQARG